MPSSRATRCSTADPPSFCLDRSIMFTETTSDVWLVTSLRPASSMIWPRTAGTTTARVWLAIASVLNWVPFITCRYHSRPPSVAIIATTIT